MNNHSTPKTWGGGTFDIVSPTFKNVGGRVPPSPRICAHASMIIQELADTVDEDDVDCVFLPQVCDKNEMCETWFAGTNVSLKTSFSAADISTFKQDFVTSFSYAGETFLQTPGLQYLSIIGKRQHIL